MTLLFMIIFEFNNKKAIEIMLISIAFLLERVLTIIIFLLRRLICQALTILGKN